MKMLSRIPVVLLAGGLLLASASALSTENAEERREARDIKQDTRQEARDTKQECRAENDQSNAECRQDKREDKQEGRDESRDARSGN